MPPKKSTTRKVQPAPSDDTQSNDVPAAQEATATAANILPRRSTRVTSSAATTEQKAADTEKAAAPKKDQAASGSAVKELEAKLQAAQLGSDEKPKPKKQKEYLNPLPSPPQSVRPAPLLYVWGAGNAGQFGMGVEILDELQRPQRNKLVEKMADDGKFGAKGAGLQTVAAGGMSSLFIDEQGTIWSCGANDNAALGRDTSDIPDPENEGAFLDIDALSSVPYPIQSLVDEGFRAVRAAAGDSIAAAISIEGEMRVWGTFRAMEGLLGFSGNQKHQYLPVPVLTLKSKPGDVEKFVDVAAGNDHVVVLTTHGNVYTWGVGERGQLGRKVLERHKITATTPERILLGKRTNMAVAVGAGSYASFAVDTAGDVWGWGANSTGQTGTGFVDGNTNREIHMPRRVAGLSAEELGDGEQVVQIAGGDDHTLFLTSEGRVYSCGLSIGGQLGLADDDDAFEDRTFPDFLDKPALVTFPDEDDHIIQISAGPRTSMAISRDGVLYMWGEGSQSELGAGPTEMLKVPTVLVRKEGSYAAVMGSCGGQHALALLKQRQK